MRKIILLLILLVISAVAMTWLYFTNMSTSERQNDVSLNAAVKGAAIVASYSNSKEFYKLMEEQSLFQEIVGSKRMDLLRFVRQNIIEQTDLYSILKNRKIYCSIIPGKENTELLLSTQLNDIDEAVKLGVLLKKNLKANNSSTQLLTIKNDSISIFIGIKDKLILLSTDENIVKTRLVEQPAQNNQAFENYIKEASKFQKNSLLNIYADYKLLSPIINELTNTANNQWNRFKDLDGFADLSYNFSKERLLFIGNSIINSGKSYNYLFSTQKAQPIFITDILPSATENYCLFGISDYKTWLVNMDKFYADKQDKRLENTLKSIKEKYLVDLRKAFITYFKNQFITFDLYTGEKLGAIALKNGDKIRQQLIELSNANDEEIFSFKESGILYSLFGDPLFRFDKPYYVIKGNYLIFANNPGTIRSFLRSFENDDRLINSPLYSNFRNEFPGEANVSLYVNLLRSKTFSTLCYQLMGDNGKFQTNLLLTKRMILGKDSLE